MSRSISPRTVCVAAAAMALSSGGCQTYTPRPIDLPGSLAAYHSRSPADPLVAAAAGSIGQTFEPADGFSLAEAQAVAVVFNAELRLARLRAGVAAAEAQHAGLWQDPVVGVDVTRILASVDHRWKLGGAIGFTIPVSGRLAIERARAERLLDVEQARLAAQEWEVRGALSRAWAEWTSLGRQVAAESVYAERSSQVLAIIDAMERAGELPRTEARLFRIDQATRRAQSDRLGAQRAAARAELLGLLGLAASAPIDLIDSDMDAIAPDAQSDLTPALAASNTAVAVALAEHQVAEEDLRLAVARQHPDLTLAPGGGREDGNAEIGLGFSVPIPVLNANRQEIARARARREVTAAAAEATLERCSAELAAAQAAYVSARALVEHVQRVQLPLVEAQQREARELARLGEVNALVLLESLSQEHAAQLSLIQARRDADLAAARITMLLGPAVAGPADHRIFPSVPPPPPSGVTP